MESKNQQSPFDKLKDKLASKKIPKTIQLSQGEFILDVQRMIDSHVRYLENNTGNLAYMPYWHRLVKLNSLLSS